MTVTELIEALERVPIEVRGRTSVIIYTENGPCSVIERTAWSFFEMQDKFDIVLKGGELNVQDHS